MLVRRRKVMQPAFLDDDTSLRRVWKQIKIKEEFPSPNRQVHFNFLYYLKINQTAETDLSRVEFRTIKSKLKDYTFSSIRIERVSLSPIQIELLETLSVKEVSMNGVEFSEMPNFKEPTAITLANFRPLRKSTRLHGILKRDCEKISFYGSNHSVFIFGSQVNLHRICLKEDIDAPFEMHQINKIFSCISKRTNKLMLSLKLRSDVYTVFDKLKENFRKSKIKCFEVDFFTPYHPMLPRSIIPQFRDTREIETSITLRSSTHLPQVAGIISWLSHSNTKVTGRMTKFGNSLPTFVTSCTMIN